MPFLSPQNVSCSQCWGGQSVELARELLKQLPKAASDSFTVIFGDGATADLAEGVGGLSNPVLRVNPNLSEPLAGPLLIVGAQNLQARICVPITLAVSRSRSALIKFLCNGEQCETAHASHIACRICSTRLCSIAWLVELCLSASWMSLSCS